MRIALRRRFELTAADGLDALRLAEVVAPPLIGPHDVRLEMRAWSLNYRDLLFAWGVYNPKARFTVVPLSDGAGGVIQVGESVSRWKVGDRMPKSWRCRRRTNERVARLPMSAWSRALSAARGQRRVRIG